MQITEAIYKDLPAQSQLLARAAAEPAKKQPLVQPVVKNCGFDGQFFAVGLAW